MSYLWFVAVIAGIFFGMLVLMWMLWSFLMASIVVGLWVRGLYRAFTTRTWPPVFLDHDANRQELPAVQSHSHRTRHWGSGTLPTFDATRKL